MGISKKKRDELFSKIEDRLGKELGTKKDEPETEVKGLRSEGFVSTNYLEFKKEILPKHLNIYERLCKISEYILKLKPDKKTSEVLQEEINLCHMSATPAGVTSLSILAPIIFVLVTSMVTFLLFNSLFFVVYAIIMGFVLMFVLQKLPEFFANSWRLKASNQMVECIFYIATYMRHTSNLELAIEFASKHLSPPLSLDLKKVLWDVETQRYGTIQESLDNYLETWRKWNMEFIEAFHLIEGSLLEPSEERRLSMVDRALNVMLQETYERMLHYAHELKGPITTLYMIGIILPVLGLVIMPLVASFMTSKDLMPDMLAIYIAVLYNITLPLIVFYLSRTALSKRPTGYGEMDISEQNPEFKKYRNIIFKIGSSEISIDPIYLSVIIGVVLLLIGIMPLAIKYVVPKDILLREAPSFMGLKFFDYHYSQAEDANQILIGPYGVGALLLSLCVPLSFGISIGFYFKNKTKNLIKIREETKQLETEFASSLFQLGNRLGDGLPTEIAIDKVASVMKDSVSGEFFELVSTNIHNLGMSVEQAIFHPKRGALVFYPSRVIESSMKVLVESSKKGPLIASQALINVSEYIKEIHRVNERLRDLMADIVADMKQQVNMLAPAIAGIVVGITSMIITVIGKLGENLGTLQQTTEATGAGGFGGAGMLGMFGDGVPGFHFQVIVGLYIVEITYLLTVLINGIEAGSDKLSEKHQLGENLFKSAVLYAVISFIIIILFNLLAVKIIGSGIGASV